MVARPFLYFKMKKSFVLFIFLSLQMICLAGNYTIEVGETKTINCTANAPLGGWITHVYYSFVDNNDADYIALSCSSVQQAATITGIKKKSNIKIEVTYCYTYKGSYDNQLHVGSGTYYDYITVTGGVSPTAIKINPNNATIRAGESVTLTAELTPSNAYLDSYNWGIVDVLSSKSQNFSLKCSGNKCYVTAKKGVGKIYVISQTDNGKVLGGAYVTAVEDDNVIEPTNLSLSSDVVVLNIGSSTRLDYSILPEGATTSLSWSSSDENVATVSEEGVIHAVGKGETTIVATTNNGVTAECKVVVTKRLSVKSAVSSIYPYQNPSFVFNDLIHKGEDFDKISITDENNNVIESESIIQGDTLYVCFTKVPKLGEYKINIPSFSITNQEGEFNSEYERQVRVGNAGYVSVAAGYKYSMALKANGTLWIAGYNMRGLLGDGETTSAEDFTLAASGVSSIYGCRGTLYYIKGKALYGWGYNLSGCLGNGTTKNNMTAKFILNDVKMFSGDGETGMAIKNDGSLWSWGSGSDGVIGNGKKETQLRPVKILSNVRSVSVQASTAIAVDDDSCCWGWGSDYYNVLGLHNTSYATLPVKLNNKKVNDVTCGWHRAFFIHKDNSLWGVGENLYGQIGDGTKTDRSEHVSIMEDVESVVNSYDRTYAIKKNGELWGWGKNYDGYLGDGTQENRLSPVKILDNVREVAVGGEHAIAVKNDGSLWCWGSNSYGQIGISDSRTYVPVCITPSAVFVVVDTPEICLSKGEKYVLNISTYPVDGIYESIKCISANNDIATVNDRGIVTALNNGQTEISIEMKAGENIQKTTCTVVVNENQEQTAVCPTTDIRESCITIYSINGSIIYQGKSMPKLSHGVYIIRTVSGSKKIVI